MKNKGIKNYKDDKFTQVIPAQFAEKLRVAFIENPKLWDLVITPKTAVAELKQLTSNDYSEIWDTYCDCCFKPINKNTLEMCYVSEDYITWLCENCYKKIMMDDNS